MLTANDPGSTQVLDVDMNDVTRRTYGGSTHVAPTIVDSTGRLPAKYMSRSKAALADYLAGLRRLSGLRDLLCG